MNTQDLSAIRDSAEAVKIQGVSEGAKIYGGDIGGVNTGPLGLIRRPSEEIIHA